MPTIEEIFARHEKEIRAEVEAEAAKTAEQKEAEKLDVELGNLTTTYAAYLKSPSLHARELKTLSEQIETKRQRYEELIAAQRQEQQQAAEWEYYRAAGGMRP